jgi:hypothetical protein
MIIHMHSDALYLSVSHPRSHLDSLLFCGDKPTNEDNLNESILNVAVIIKNLVASAAESEVGACFQTPKLVRQL